MQFESIIYERRDNIAYVTLNRPERLNALNPQLTADLTVAATLIASDSEVRAILLTGSGRAFCSGADLLNEGFSTSSTSAGPDIEGVMRNYYNPMVTAWYDLTKPVVVAVNGVAAGAGASLALLGDIVLAARSATFLLTFAPKLGLMPDLGASFFLPRLIGAARARGLALLGDALSAEDAANWGLIWASIEDSQLLANAEALARRLSHGPTQAYRLIKSVFNNPSDTLPEQLAVELLHQSALGKTADFAEGITAFRAKRVPNFKGC